MILKLVGYGWIGIFGIAALVIGVAASYFIFIGGIFDLFTDRTLTSGIGWVDERNRDYLARHGDVTVGLVKVFLGEPVVLTLASIVFAIGAVPGAAIAAIGESRSETP